MRIRRYAMRRLRTNIRGRARRKVRSAKRRVIERDGYGDNWPRQRAKALKRDNYTCQRCGHVGKRRKRSGRLSVSVHHITKIKDFVDLELGVVDYDAANDLDNLVVLCEVNGCHALADGHKKLKMIGFKPFSNK